MRYSAKALASVTPAELVEIIHPCHVTHNLVQALISLQRAVEERGGVFEDDPRDRPLVYGIANQAADLIPSAELGRELDALKSTHLSHDLRASLMVLAQSSSLDISRNLTITLYAVYAELLKKIVARPGRAASAAAPLMRLVEAYRALPIDTEEPQP